MLDGAVVADLSFYRSLQVDKVAFGQSLAQCRGDLDRKFVAGELIFQGVIVISAVQDILAGMVDNPGR